jgi:anti-sigma regulatory factor (Ser/Thr protein kinase)
VSATAPSTPVPPPGEQGTFQHEALFYAGDESFLAGTVPFVRDGVAAGEPVLVVLPPVRLTLLQAALGGDVAHVAFADMAEVGRNPARIIPAWRDFLSLHGGGSRPVRGIDEPIWAGRRPAELVECQRHETLLNLAFAGSGSWRLLCPYDVDALGPAVVEEAERSHPFVTATGRRQASERCLDHETMARPFDVPLPPAPPGAAELPFGGAELGAVRRFVTRLGRQAGLDDIRTDDLALAVHEIASNSVRHAHRGGVVTVWEDDGAVVVEVRDPGRIEDPLVGREQAPPDRPDGRGVWLANHLCDLVQIRTFPTGNVIRLHLRSRPTL